MEEERWEKEKIERNAVLSVENAGTGFTNARICKSIFRGEQMTKTLLTIEALMIIFIFLLVFNLGQFFMIRYELTKIEAEGLECCHALDCEYNFFGSIKCVKRTVPDPDFNYYGLDLNGSQWNNTVAREDWGEG